MIATIYWFFMVNRQFSEIDGELPAIKNYKYVPNTIMMSKAHDDINKNRAR